MERKSKKRAEQDKAKSARLGSLGAPLGSLHKDHGWTPEQLRAELKAEGLDYDEEVAKQRRLIATLKTRHLSSSKLDDAPPGSSTDQRFSFFDEAAAAGFPNWAGDGLASRKASVYELLGQAKQDDAVWLKVSEPSMSSLGIIDGSYVLVQAGVEAKDGDVVAAHVSGHGTVVKRLRITDAGILLVSDSPAFNDIVIDSASCLKIHGVVRGCVVKLD